MKFKRILATVLAGCIALSMTACSSLGGGGSQNNNTSNTNTSSSSKNSSVPKIDNDSSSNSSSEEEDSSKIVYFSPTDKGQVIEAKDGKQEIEIHWNTISRQQEVYSNSTNKFASYFPDKDGESYICAKMTIKNVGGESVSYDIFRSSYSNTIQVTFGDKYNYSMQQLDMASSVMSQYWSLQPLKSCEVYFVQSVPDEVFSMPFVITFSVGDTTYETTPAIFN